MGTAIAKALAILDSAKGQEQFIEWSANPVTQAFLAAGRELARPQRPSEGLTTDFLLGKSVGGNEIIDFFLTPKGTMSEIKQALGRLTPSYGAVGILKEGNI